MNQVANDVPLIKGYSDFSMKQLDGFQGISLELNFLDGELNFEVTRDNYALIEEDVIKVGVLLIPNWFPFSWMPHRNSS